MKQRSVYICCFIGMIGVVLTLVVVVLTQEPREKKVVVPKDWIDTNYTEYHFDSISHTIKTRIIKETDNP